MGDILLVSGPTLDRLGTREPALYGTATLTELVAEAREVARRHGHDLEHVQSDDEQILVDVLRAASGTYAAIVINAAHFTHTSEAIADALRAFDGLTIELHITNPHAREQWRRTSVLAPVVTGIIAGLGGAGYRFALEAVCEKLDP